MNNDNLESRRWCVENLTGELQTKIEVEYNLRIKKEHVDSYKPSTTPDVPGLPKTEQVNLNGGGRVASL